MAKQEAGDARIPIINVTTQGFEGLQVIFEGAYVRPMARGAAMTKVIGRHDRIATAGEVVRKVLIAATVLAQAVGQQNDASRRIVGGPVTIKSAIVD